MNDMLIPLSDSWLYFSVGQPFFIKIKKFIKSIVREGFLRPNDELLINASLTFTYPVNLAY